jgi:hypothetical protein
VDYFEKVRTYVGFCDVVLLLVKGDDKSDNIDGGRGAAGGVLAEEDGLHEDPKGLVDPVGIVSQACQKGVNVGVLAFPMLGEGNEAGSEWNQYLVIHFDMGNFFFGRAGGRGLVADSLAEGLAKFVLGGLASGSFGQGSGGRGGLRILDLVGGTSHDGSLGYYVGKEGGQSLGEQHSHAAAQPDQVAQFHEALGERHSHAAAQPDPNEALGEQHPHAAAQSDPNEALGQQHSHAAAQPDPNESLGEQHSHAAAQPDPNEALGEQHSHAAAQPDPNEALGEQHSHAPGHQDEWHGTAAWQLFPLKHSLIV